MVKSHKAFGKDIWLQRLRRFADQGHWTPDLGSRPGPRQPKNVLELYNKVQKCPRQCGSQQPLTFRGVAALQRGCTCGLHRDPHDRAGIQRIRQYVESGRLAELRQRPNIQPNLQLERHAAGQSRPTPASATATAGAPSPAAAAAATAAAPGPAAAAAAAAAPSGPGSATAAAAAAAAAPSGPGSATAAAAAAAPGPAAAAAAAAPGSAAAAAHNLSRVAPSNPLHPRGNEGARAPVLPYGWASYLSPWEQSWIGGLFRTVTHGGRTHAELRAGLTELWCRPPPPPLVANQAPPGPDRYFGVPLFLWLPRRFWGVLLSCPECGTLLNSFGLHSRLRKVVDLELGYWMATERLTCPQCRPQKVYTAWDHRLIRQLDLARQRQFPAVLTYKLTCDKAVIRLLRERGLGNSPAQLQKKIAEQVGEEYLSHTLRYLGDCAMRSAAFDGWELPFAPPPPHPVVPSARWLMRVYLQDALTRHQEYLAAITSVFGEILKMDSTRKVAKKLAGAAANTARWATNVTNEHGLVLNCVLTATEGAGLLDMGRGLVARYRDAKVMPPRVLYVDRDCCGATQTTPAPALHAFPGWEGMPVRLDAWHFMRRLAAGVTTDAHQLYGLLMSRLSAAIFETDPGDLAALIRAKRQELAATGITNLSDEVVHRAVTKAEHQRHCRRRTRGVEVTTRAIDELLRLLSGPAGVDSMGLPLLDQSRIWTIWEQQKRHVACLQDVPGVPLHRVTGTLMKGGVQLSCFRTARGTTSTESFHSHLVRFIPGTTASDLHFQAFLIEGLVRWNADRHLAAIGQDSAREVRCYDGRIRAAVNDLSQRVLKRDLVTRSEPLRYTGELVGVAYLYGQTGRRLDEYRVGDPDTQHGEDDDVGDDLDEGFEDVEDIFVTDAYDGLEMPLQTPLPAAPVGVPSLAAAGPQGPATARVPSSADAGPQSPADAGPQSPADAGPQSPANAGPQSPADAGPQSPADAGPQSPADAGPQSPADAGPQSPADAGPQNPAAGPQSPAAAAAPGSAAAAAAAAVAGAPGPAAAAAPGPAAAAAAAAAPSGPGSATAAAAAPRPAAAAAPRPAAAAARGPAAAAAAAAAPSGPGSATAAAHGNQPPPAPPAVDAASWSPADAQPDLEGRSSPGPGAVVAAAQSPAIPLTPDWAAEGLPEDVTGPDHQPGYAECHRLAQVLVGLDCSRGYVADEEAESIVHLWHQLSAGDRAKVAASPRYQHRLTTGRFKQPKTSRLSGVVPGVDSARRVSLKRGAVPAQRPDLNRLAETVVRLLCERYRNPRRSGGSVQSRWAQILAHHSSLRDILLKCPAITQRTGVNLAALNQHTLTSWFNEHQKETERRALLQGVQLPPARPIAAVALPAPAPRLMQVQVVRVDCRRPPHHFVLPADTVGQAQTRRRPAEDTGHDTAAKRPYTRRQPTNTCGQCK
ncbi:uncharacterized protein LOC122363529, partial [Amphibalanus amphitrite]|uniref:uncharacterized protein LOC122363529 n=1 Tax=Amphibalanus amphitrite TaxID=1232801 RepID=UPI001C8FFE2F